MLVALHENLHVILDFSHSFMAVVTNDMKGTVVVVHFLMGAL